MISPSGAYAFAKPEIVTIVLFATRAKLVRIVTVKTFSSQGMLELPKEGKEKENISFGPSYWYAKAASLAQLTGYLCAMILVQNAGSVTAIGPMSESRGVPDSVHVCDGSTEQQLTVSSVALSLSIGYAGIAIPKAWIDTGGEAWGLIGFWTSKLKT
eukprot:1127807-Rhodomonas_salina.2